MWEPEANPKAAPTDPSHPCLLLEDPSQRAEKELLGEGPGPAGAPPPLVLPPLSRLWAQTP